MKLIKENMNVVLGFLVGAAIAVIVMGLMWPKKIAKLSNGEEVLATYGDKKVTANDLFNELKVFNGGIDALLQIVDIGILSEKYTDEAARNEYAVNQVDTNIETLTNQGLTESEALLKMNVQNRNEAIEYFKNQYYFKTYYDDYFANKFTDKEIKEYYEEKVFGTKNITILSSVSDKNDLDKAREMLKNKKTVEQITKKYPNLAVNYVDELTYDMAPSYSEIFIKNVMGRKKGEYSKVFSDDSYGYVLLIINDSKAKPALEDAKKNIVEILTNDLLESDDLIYDKALNKLRNENGLKIYDTNLKSAYKNYQRDVK